MNMTLHFGTLRRTLASGQKIWFLLVVLSISVRDFSFVYHPFFRTSDCGREMVSDVPLEL